MKKVYLTIDDAPSEKMNEKLDFLINSGIPAIWFCTGSNLEKRSEIAIKAIENGFIIGNHSFDHPHFPELSLESCINQISKTDLIIKEIYHRAGIKSYPKYFRFPYGEKKGPKEKTDAIQRYLKNNGYQRPLFEKIDYKYFHKELDDDVDWLWTFDTLDWSINADNPIHGIDCVEKVFGRMDENLPEEGRGLQSDSHEIILIHDHLESSDIFPQIINQFHNKKIQFVYPEEINQYSWTMKSKS